MHSIVYSSSDGRIQFYIQYTVKGACWVSNVEISHLQIGGRQSLLTLISIFFRNMDVFEKQAQTLAGKCSSLSDFQIQSFKLVIKTIWDAPHIFDLLVCI